MSDTRKRTPLEIRRAKARAYYAKKQAELGLTVKERVRLEDDGFVAASPEQLVDARKARQREQWRARYARQQAELGIKVKHRLSTSDTPSEKAELARVRAAIAKALERKDE